MISVKPLQLFSFPYESRFMQTSASSGDSLIYESVEILFIGILYLYCTQSLSFRPHIDLQKVTSYCLKYPC